MDGIADDPVGEAVFSSKTTFLSAATARDTRKSQKATFSSDEKVKDNMVKPHGRLVVVD